MARPRVFEEVEELQGAIDAYFLVAKVNNEKVTMSGLAYSLGFADRQSLYDYEKNDKFSCTIKRALLRIEQSYETALYGNSVAGPIFALKNMGWRDKVETGFTDKDGNDIPVTVFQLPDNGRNANKDNQTTTGVSDENAGQPG